MKAVTSSIWTNAAVERLRDLVRQRRSASQIMIALGIPGLTRNAVAGKADRLGLTLGGKSGKRLIKHASPAPQQARGGTAMPPPVRPVVQHGGLAAVNAIRALERRANDPGLDAEAFMPRETPAPTQAGRHVTIMGLNNRACRWPLFDDPSAPVESNFYCGGATEDGPYCGHHASRAYPKPMTKSEARIVAELRLRAARVARASGRAGARA